MVFKKGHKINLGRKTSDYQKKRVSQIHKGKILSEETKKKIREARAKQVMLKGKEHPNYGKPIKDEIKIKISNKLKGRKISEEHKRKISESNKIFGHIISKEVRQKMNKNRKIRKGKEHWNWTGGKPRCIKCGSELSSYNSKMCIKCLRIKENHPLFGKHFSEESKEKMSESHKKIKTPKIDTSIEVKIQNYLKLLHIEFITHYYISNITNKYQCDILIPEQEMDGVIIKQKTIIECDGCYWHGCHICNKEIKQFQLEHIERDKIRTQELEEKGYRVIRLWEHNIKVMELNDLKEKIA